MHDTDATMMTSSRSSSARVARVAHAVDLLVDRGFLLDIGVGARDIGLGLVVVVIADEIFDRVVRKEAPELAVELGRERLVGREHQRRALRLLDHLGHGEGLARAGDAEQHLGAVLAPDALDQVGDRLRLVALGLEIRLDHQPLAAFGFLRPRRPVRRPRPLAEFGPALAQQRFQRLHGGGGAGDAAKGGDDLACSSASAAAASSPSKPSACASSEFTPKGVRPTVATLAGVARLRRLVEALRGRLARPVGGGEVGAPVERVVRRRLAARSASPARRCPGRCRD